MRPATLGLLIRGGGEVTNEKRDVAGSIARLARKLLDSESLPSGALDAIADEALSYFSAKSCIVALADHSVTPARFRIVSIAGDAPDGLLSITVPMEGSTIGAAYDSRLPILVTDFVDVPPLNAAAAAALGSAATLFLPCEGEAVVVLHGSKKDSFPPEVIDDSLIFCNLVDTVISLATGSEAKERERLRADLHDGALQMLQSVAIQLELALDEPTAEKERDEVASALADLRMAIGQIRSEFLNPGGSKLSLNELLGQIQSCFGDANRVVVEALDADLSSADPRTVDLGRIALEAVSNAVCHAEARTIVARFESGADGLTLSIADDGRGFALGEVSPGQGLANMSRRAERLGGEFRIDTEPGRGTEVRVILPEV